MTVGALALALTLSAANTMSLAAPDFEATQVPPEVARLVTRHFTQQLSLRGWKVVTSSDIATALGAERQKQLLGCTDSTGCLVELANALAVDGIVVGSLGKLGEQRLLNIKVIKPDTAAALAVFSARASSDDALLTEVERAVGQIDRELRKSLKISEPVTAEATARTSTGWTSKRKLSLIPMAGGLVSVLLGGTLLGLAGAARADLADLTAKADPARVSEAFQKRNDGEKLGWSGVGLVAIGGALIALGVYLFFDEPPARPALTFGPGSAGLQWAGSWP